MRATSPNAWKTNSPTAPSNLHARLQAPARGLTLLNQPQLQVSLSLNARQPTERNPTERFDMRLRWTEGLEKQARGALAPLKLPKTLTGLEKARHRWEKQREQTEHVLDNLALRNPNGCDAPITEGDADYIDFCWASTQRDVCVENLRRISASILNMRCS